MPRSTPEGDAPERGRRGRAGTRPVMDDVARRAGVSKQTVSRVLNEYPAVRAETRERVLEAVRALGYRPGPGARPPAGGRNRMLGVISFDAVRYGPASILDAINGAARDAGHLVSSIVLDTAGPGTVVEAVQRLTAEGADGVIAIAPQRWVGRAIADAGLRTPLVMLDNDLGDGTPLVTTDAGEGARRATEHLLALGHATVQHIAGPEGWIASDHRLDGWRAALGAAGATVPAPLFGDWSAVSGYELGRRLAARPDVTAVFASNDQMALGVLRALYEAGRRVPEDVSVIGYDDIPEAAFVLPPLTTVRTDFARIGRQCLRLLLARLDGGRERYVRSAVPAELIVRTSSGRAPRPGRRSAFHG
ncbi:LacI family DNA-binding transcriptional regulator [Streptomyces sp. SP18CS02]|uniref:LacI family DNA-binding transcriptional regulator n=1 Tax=Streptomyces sp. SP18CS02 TaxID=3002531 RepID=UPI002E75C4FB|nr:LacI family DNA-binding transcriptional regulator [Streptomyces sp. SP18CS02]MEE1752980.1 LacI family DNA-binding transcriptional regulator [Streptomyces sp. SP18CS02]